MSPKALAYWRADAEQTPSIKALEGKIEFTSMSIKYGLNPWFYKELLEIYLYELKWRTAPTTDNRYIEIYKEMSLLKYKS